MTTAKDVWLARLGIGGKLVQVYGLVYVIAWFAVVFGIILHK